MTIVRPSIVYGPNVDNYLVRLWENARFMPLIDGVVEEFQLVHEDDLVSALVLLLDEKVDGAFNVAGDGTMTWKDAGEMIGLKSRKMSMRMLRRIYGAMWRLRIGGVEAPPGNLRFSRYPWLVSNEKLKAVGWEPTKGTREVFVETMRARGLLSDPEPQREAAPA